MEYSSVIQVATANLAFDSFTGADGAVPATVFTGQTWGNVAGTQAIATNRLQLTTNPSTRTISTVKDIVARLKAISGGGEGLMFRRASGGSYLWVTVSTSAGVKLGYFDGSADTTLATDSKVWVANDLLVLVAVGPNITVLRGTTLTTLKISLQYSTTQNVAETVHGILAKGNGGAVLVDDWVMIPAF